MSLNRVLHPLQAWFHALHHKLQPVLVVLKLHVWPSGDPFPYTRHAQLSTNQLVAW